MFDASVLPRPIPEGSIERLRSLCGGFGIELSDEEARLCIAHLLLVIDENTRVNLTRILDFDDALILHILDSLLLLPSIDLAPEGAILDMGTGAGFPAIPLAICSARSVTALDSVGKKVAAVATFTRALHLDSLTTVHDRLESYASANSNSFSCVVARAVASLPVLIEYATPFLCSGGYLVVTKGNPSDEEIASGDRAAEICGLELIDSRFLELPCDLGHRTILTYEKVSKPQIKLPRATGIAKKAPLA